MSLLSKARVDQLFCMFKGEPGTRKSTQALSFPTPQYWFSTDQKMNAMILPSKKWKIDMEKVVYDDYFDYDSIRIKLEKLQSNCPYKTIVLDSLTSTGDVTNRQSMMQKTEEGKGQFVGGIRVDSLDDYKAEAAAFREIIALLKGLHRDYKVHVILVAHVVGERAKVDAKGNKIEVQTAHSRIIVTGGKIIGAKIASYCNEIYHFDIKEALNPDREGDFGIVTRHTGEDFARTALPLARRISFKDEPLYETHLLPAITKLQGED